MPKPKKSTSKTVARSNQKVSKLVSQTVAATHCGLSPTAFRYQLNQLSDVPGVDRSGGTQGWKFNLEVLDAYRLATGNLTKGGDDTDENSPGYRTKSNQADMLDIKLAQMRGELITKDNAIRECTMGYVWWAREIDTWPDKWGRAMNMTPEQIEFLRKLADESRKGAHARFAKAGLLAK